jgi:hypothetical protein
MREPSIAPTGGCSTSGSAHGESCRPTTISNWGKRPGPPTDWGSGPADRKSAGHAATAATWPSVRLVSAMR